MEKIAAMNSPSEDEMKFYLMLNGWTYRKFGGFGTPEWLSPNNNIFAVDLTYAYRRQCIMDGFLVDT